MGPLRLSTHSWRDLRLSRGGGSATTKDIKQSASRRGNERRSDIDQFALVSGLGISDAAVDWLKLKLLKECLLGESLRHSDQASATSIPDLSS